MRKFILFLFFTGIFLAIVTSFALFWAYNYFNRDLPNFDSIADYRPPLVSSIYDRNGKIVAEIFEEHRYFAKFDEIPPIVKQAFLSSEDADFYNHPGIDIISIIRATIKNLQAGGHKQGASTITQQVVKNLLLTKEKSLERKIKEAILSYRLEKRFTKDEIFELYLNQIFLGNKAYGVKAAARLYYHKEMDQLTLAEVAILAGMPQAPSKFSPISNYKSAKQRQKYVLSQMVKGGYATKNDAELAYEEKFQFYRASGKGVYEAPYYVTEVQEQFKKMFKDYRLETDGLEVYTALDFDGYTKAQSALRKGLKEVDKRRGWRGGLGNLSTEEEYLQKFKVDENIVSGMIYPAYVTSIAGKTADILVGKIKAKLDFSTLGWSAKQVNEKDDYSFKSFTSILKRGDVIEVTSSEKEGMFNLDQTPEIEGAITLIDPFTGQVPVVIGGYSFEKSQFNRATQSLRQPGSSFKPIVYLSAVDAFKYTPATIVHDQPRTFTIGDQVWTPANYDKSYLGGITLRTALEKSRNLVSVDIISKIGIEAPIKYAKRLGITTPLGRNLSLSLGSSEVIPFEITRAYGVFPAGGVYHPSVYITKIQDRYGKVLYDYREDKSLAPTQVINEDVAFVMANMMKGVVESGTAQKIKALKRVVAGKTGTSNDQMDTWFIGYTPELVCGVWAGFDMKRPIGKGETGGAVSAPIWLYFMQDLIARDEQMNFEIREIEQRKEADNYEITYQEPVKIINKDFTPTPGVTQLYVNRAGAVVDPKTPGAIKEFFVKGTEPNNKPKAQQVREDYWQSNDL